MAAFRQTVGALLRSLSAFRLLSHKDVQERANRFLMQNLLPAQRQQYERHAYFDVIGGDTGNRYRIRHGYQMNVEQLDQNGRRTRLLCFMPRGGLPVGDIMLAQKIALELFERETLNVANGSLMWDLGFEEEMRLRRVVRRR